MKNLRIALILFLASSYSIAQPTIFSGPMNGYSTMNEAAVWVQLEAIPVNATLIFWNTKHPELRSEIYPTEVYDQRHPIFKFFPTNLDPGERYGYVLQVDGDTLLAEDSLSFTTQALWQYRTDPPNFKIALGSCAYINEPSYDRPGNPYGSNYEIFDAIVDKTPDAMLWLGDNIYLREYDVQTFQGYLHRYDHTRSTESMQRLLRSTQHYAIWDDHDFGPNDALSSWIHKDWALTSFKRYWANPSYGIPGQPGITTAFRMNDMDFFLLDNRYNRTSHDTKGQTPQILGKEQIEWLIENLKYSNAPFKFVAVGGQVLNPARVYENHAQYELEREYLLNRIIEEKIDGVIFLTGDRHHTELRKIDVDGVKIHDLTVSPLTSGTHEAENESTQNLVANTVVNKHNFAVLEFSGERLARQLKISIFDKDGLEIWSKFISR